MNTPPSNKPRPPAGPDFQFMVATTFTEQHLASREIEEQTRVRSEARALLLWHALRNVLADCLEAWHQLAGRHEDNFVQLAGRMHLQSATEVDRLVCRAFDNPLDLKAVARTAQLGLNARRTLDLCLEGMLDEHENHLANLKPMARLDWALGGLAGQPQAHAYAFEETLGVEFAKNAVFYSTEKNARKDISARQIANIFCVKDQVIEALETRALNHIKRSIPGSEGINEFALDFMASQ